jgi:hypothetical protein
LVSHGSVASSYDSRSRHRQVGISGAWH